MAFSVLLTWQREDVWTDKNPRPGRVDGWTGGVSHLLRLQGDGGESRLQLLEPGLQLVPDLALRAHLAHLHTHTRARDRDIKGSKGQREDVQPVRVVAPGPPREGGSGT